MQSLQSALPVAAAVNGPKPSSHPQLSGTWLQSLVPASIALDNARCIVPPRPFGVIQRACCVCAALIVGSGGALVDDAVEEEVEDDELVLISFGCAPESMSPNLPQRSVLTNFLMESAQSK